MPRTSVHRKLPLIFPDIIIAYKITDVTKALTDKYGLKTLHTLTYSCRITALLFRSTISADGNSLINIGHVSFAKLKFRFSVDRRRSV
jgi:hypothetical protein